MTTISGKLIVLEGIDGSGTTTHAVKLEQWMAQQGLKVHRTQEPSNGPIGSLIRLALTHRVGNITAEGVPQPLDEATMALAFAADRADHLACEIIPRLKSGIHVICDRYYLSSLAYQGPQTSFEWVRQLNVRFARPDLTILLEIPLEVWTQRMEEDRRAPQLYEQLERQKSVRAGYQAAVEMLQGEGEHIAIISSDRPTELVHEEIVRIANETLAS